MLRGHWSNQSVYFTGGYEPLPLASNGIHKINKTLVALKLNIIDIP